MLLPRHRLGQTTVYSSTLEESLDPSEVRFFARLISPLLTYELRTENLAAGTGANYGIAEAIKSWTDEVCEYMQLRSGTTY